MRSLARTLTLAAVSSSLILGSGVVHAQDKDQDAERLFREGQKLMEERRYGDACPKFEAAYRKDQQLGTLLNLAYCHKEQGATWQAWLEFKDAEMKATELRRSDRKEFARQRMTELEKEKALTRMVIEPTTKVELTEVLVEDRRIPEAEKSVPFAVEPGRERKVTFRAKGKKDKVHFVSVSKSDKPMKVAVPDMVDEEKAPPPPAVVDPPPPPPPTHQDVRPVEPPKEKSDGSTQRVLAYGLGGLAVVGIAVGTVEGLAVINNPCSNQTPEEKAGTKPSPCTPDEKSKGDTASLVATISFAAGGAALVGALILYFTAPSSDAKTGKGFHVTPEMGVGWAGFRGAF